MTMIVFVVVGALANVCNNCTTFYGEAQQAPGVCQDVDGSLGFPGACFLPVNGDCPEPSVQCDSFGHVCDPCTTFANEYKNTSVLCQVIATNACIYSHGLSGFVTSCEQFSDQLRTCATISTFAPTKSPTLSPTSCPDDCKGCFLIGGVCQDPENDQCPAGYQDCRPPPTPVPTTAPTIHVCEECNGKLNDVRQEPGLCQDVDGTFKFGNYTKNFCFDKSVVLGSSTCESLGYKTCNAFPTTESPTPYPTVSSSPTNSPTTKPTQSPTKQPTNSPTDPFDPTTSPTISPTTNSSTQESTDDSTVMTPGVIGGIAGGVVVTGGAVWYLMSRSGQLVTESLL